MDDEYEEVDERGLQPIRLNWSDIALTVITIPRGLAEGFVRGLRNLEVALACHSQAISERQEFERSVGREIEALSEAKDE